METRYSFREQKVYDILPKGGYRVYYDEQEGTEPSTTIISFDPLETKDETYTVYRYLAVDVEDLDYNQIVVALIRAEYSVDDELALLRQKDDKASEYNAYNAYVEKCKAIAHRTIEGDTLETAKGLKIADLGIYDASEAVNAFYIGNQAMWLSPAIRTQYKDSLSDAKAAGVSMVEFAGANMPTDDAIAALTAINVYALQCQQNTAHHRAAIEALDSIAAVRAYDFTTGYPEKLSF